MLQRLCLCLFINKPFKTAFYLNLQFTLEPSALFQRCLNTIIFFNKSNRLDKQLLLQRQSWNVNNVMTLGECGRLPLCVEYHTKCIKYWCRRLQMPIHRYPKNCYIMLKRQDELGRINWVTSVKKSSLSIWLRNCMAKSRTWGRECLSICIQAAFTRL
jgi:hypothetical protein